MPIDAIVKAITTLVDLIHGDDAAKVAGAVQRFTAAVMAELPDGHAITEEELIAKADQIIADAQRRRQQINAGE